MDRSDPTPRERHLLALRSAVPVLLTATGFLAFMASILPVSQVWIMGLCAGMVVPFFGFVYAFRYVIPNRKRWLEPGQTIARPAHALRAAFGANAAIVVGTGIITVSLYLSPFLPGTAGSDLLRILKGGADAGVAVGVLVLLFSAVLYMKVRSANEEKNVEYHPYLGIAMLITFWIQGIVEEFPKHGLLMALGLSTWTVVTVFLGLSLGWSIYRMFVPELANPIKFFPRIRIPGS